MVTHNFSLLWPSRILFFVTVFIFVSCRGFNVPGNRGPVWLGEPIITSALDQQGEPTDTMEKFEAGVKVVYCYLSIKGPEGYKMYVRWYNQDTLIVEQFIDFGTERKYASDLRFEGDKPLPPGNYRCDFGLLADKPLRSVKFTIE